jgi:type VII secretion-associated protein (TIGR03931 family)
MTGSDALLIVGPADIVGGRTVRAELVTAAFEFIDDALALVEERVLPIDAAWRELMTDAVHPGAHTVVLVCPSWWRTPRIAVVRDAARHVTANVVVLRRAELLRSDQHPVIVEIAEDFVIVHALDGEPVVVPRVGDHRAVVDAIVAATAPWYDVLIDVPGGVTAARKLGEDVAHHLRLRGGAVSLADDQRVLRAAEIARTPSRAFRRRVAAVACTGLVVALGGAAAGYGADEPATPASTWLVEARVTVEVPAGWPTERVASGPGSARVQANSPSEPRAAILLIQSAGQESLAAAAEVLRRALDEQPDGVFVDFTATVRRADRTVIGYREIRRERHVEWSVMLDRGVRIAIGCQHAPDRPIPQPACEQAIRSARTLP